MENRRGWTTAAGARVSGMNDGQLEELLERIVVFVAMNQRILLADTNVAMTQSIVLRTV